MFFLSFSWCAEALCETVVQLLVHGMLACARSRTRIEVLRSKSRGGRLCAYQADLLDRRPICCHSIIRDSGSRHEGCRDCGEGAKKAKPGKWGCVQTHDLWSSKEETHVRPGHHWLLKFGKVAGSMSCVEKEFILGPRKFEEYKGCRFYNGDCTLAVDV